MSENSSYKLLKRLVPLKSNLLLYAVEKMYSKQ